MDVSTDCYGDWHWDDVGLDGEDFFAFVYELLGFFRGQELSLFEFFEIGVDVHLN